MKKILAGLLTIAVCFIGNAQSDDLDSGGGKDWIPVMGIALPADGGHVVGGTATNPFEIEIPDTMYLQLGVVEGNGTTTNAHLTEMELQLGVIEGNGTTLSANVTTYAETRELQLGVIEGNGITLNATALLIDAGVTLINSELDAQSLQLGVVEGNGTTGTAALVSIDGKMVSGTDIGDVTINNAAGASAVNIQDGGNTITVDGTVSVSSAGAVTIASPLGGGVEAGAVLVTVASDSTGLLSVDDNGGSLTIDSTSLNAIEGAGNTTVVHLASIDGKMVSGTDIGDVTINNASGGSAVNIQDGGNTITVDGSLTNISGTISLPTGASTSANQTTAITALQAIEGAGNTTVSHLATIAGAVAAGQVQVDVVAELPAGTQNIGDVDVATIAAGDNNIGNVDIATIAAGDNNIGNVDIVTDQPLTATTDTIGSTLRTDKMLDNATLVTPKFEFIDDAASGDNTIVAAVASKKIRVLQVFLVAASAVNVRFESGASGTALTGQMNLIANEGFVLPYSPVGWFETAANTLLNLELSGAVSVDGCITYIEVD